MKLKKDYKVIFISPDSYRLLADKNCKHCYGSGHVGTDMKRNKVIACKCLITVKFPINYIKIFNTDNVKYSYA